MTPSNPRPQPRSQHGLTILEMLVVIAILVATATIGFTNFTGVIEDSREKIARTEMQEIARAIKQFRQDTGYYPKQGPFGHVDDGGAVDPACVVIPDAAVPDPRGWLYSPANFWQLYANPLKAQNPLPTGCKEHLLARWNPSTARGWRGPYLNRSGEGLVDLSDDLDVSGEGSPIATSNPAKLIAEAQGIADPFTYNDRVGAPADFDDYHKLGSNEYDDWLLDWRSVGNAIPSDFAKHETNAYYLGYIGGPYFVFDLDKPSARIVSMGPNGLYGGVLLDASGETLCAPGNGQDEGNNPDDDHDDIVLCLE